MKNECGVFKNKAWKGSKPVISVITPVYNRHDILPRALNSIDSQSFRSFEYIIVNDGSTEDLDDVVIPFMEKADYPVVYLKKPNGGVHTARNLGIDYARGLLITWLDSDDELVPSALEVFVSLWYSIPEEKRNGYYQISSRCRSQKGEEGTLFPEDINSLGIRDSYKVYHRNKTENLTCNLASVMKENKWPEPEGIKFVSENILWLRLEKKYRTLFTNEVLRIYHTEGTDHIFCKDRKKDIQYVKDSAWNFSHMLNTWREFDETPRYFVECTYKYLVFSVILRRRHEKNYRLENPVARLLAAVLYLPALLSSVVYVRRKMA